MIKIKTNLIGEKLSKPLRYLYIHTIVKGLAMGLLGFFIPLYLFKILGRVEYVILYYLAGYSLVVILYPLLTKVFFRLSLNILMVIAAPLMVLYLLVLDRLKTGNDILQLLLVAIVLITIYKILYWIPYNTQFAIFTDQKHRGRQVSAVQAIISLLGISLPAISGYIVLKFGFDWLFYSVLVMYLLSTIPLRHIPKKREVYSYKYFETWKEIFNYKNRHITLAYFADGFQCIVGYVIWPIFIFLLLDGEYLSVGVVTTLITLVTVVLRLIMGDLSDHKNKRTLLKIGTWFYSFGWLAKTFVDTAMQIFFVGAYHGLAYVLMRAPLDTLTFEKAAHRGHYVDEYTVLREMAMGLGRVSALTMSLVILSFASLNWVFVLAGLMALLVAFL